MTTNNSSRPFTIRSTNPSKNPSKNRSVNGFKKRSANGFKNPSKNRSKHSQSWANIQGKFKGQNRKFTPRKKQQRGKRDIPFAALLKRINSPYGLPVQKKPAYYEDLVKTVDTLATQLPSRRNHLLEYRQVKQLGKYYDVQLTTPLAGLKIQWKKTLIYKGKPVWKGELVKTPCSTSSDYVLTLNPSAPTKPLLPSEFHFKATNKGKTQLRAWLCRRAHTALLMDRPDVAHIFYYLAVCLKRRVL